jgi:hypothetical protein
MNQRLFVVVLFFLCILVGVIRSYEKQGVHSESYSRSGLMDSELGDKEFRLSDGPDVYALKPDVYVMKEVRDAYSSYENWEQLGTTYTPSYTPSIPVSELTNFENKDYLKLNVFTGPK